MKIRTKKKVLYKVKPTNKYVWESMNLSIPHTVYNTIINKSKANYRATARQTTEEKNHSLCTFSSKKCACTDEREKKEIQWKNEWKRCTLCIQCCGGICTSVRWWLFHWINAIYWPHTLKNQRQLHIHHTTG